MRNAFYEVLNNHIIPFFEERGFNQKDINSETNKILGVESFYFFKIENDLNTNFYFESNSENSSEKYEFKIDFGIYSYQFNRSIGFPTYDNANGMGNTFSLNSEFMSEEGIYWQKISPETDLETFVKQLISNLQKTINVHDSIKNLDGLIESLLEKKSYYCDYTYMIKYLKIIENQPVLDKYVAQLKAERSDDSSAWFIEQIDKLLDTTELKQKVINNFPSGIKVPKSWLKVLDWVEKNPHTVIGGHFEVNDDSNNMIKHGFDAESKIMNDFAVIGLSSTQELFCIWNKDKKSQPIVFLGEAGNAKVLAADIDDFIQLLAIGYYEIEVADFEKEPIFETNNAHWRNEKFQAFYTKTFKKEIPKTGKEIELRKGISDEDLLDFLAENDAFWKQWNK